MSNTIRRNSKAMKFSLGPADPKTKKAKIENARFWAIIESHKKKPWKNRPMPEWAIEEATYDGKRHRSQGRPPLFTIYGEWPEARAAYLAQF